MLAGQNLLGHWDCVEPSSSSNLHLWHSGVGSWQPAPQSGSSPELETEVLVTYSCPILCDPMDCSPPGSPVHGDLPGKNIGVGCHALLQGIFPTQGLKPGLLHGRWILYHLSHQGSPIFIYLAELGLSYSM